MKNITSHLACLAIFLLPTAICLLPTFSYAQAPQKFNYQGLARGYAGNPFPNQALGFKLSILQGTPTGTAVYVETQAVTSDSKGIFSLEVGGGTVVSGVFSSIGWGANSYYLKTEMDTTGGSNYQTMGTTQMISVPYSLYSESTGDTSMWKKNGSTISYNNGEIGIGTNNPKHRLHIVSHTAQDGGGLRLENANTSYGSGIQFMGSNYKKLWALSTRNDFTGIFIRMADTNATNIKDIIYADSSGSVGIGTNFPSEKLSVAGVIESTTGGIKFPDGTTQTTAASSSSGNPEGTILSYAGATIPAGYLLCDGSAVSRTTYTNLFAALGTAWGQGDGSTTFNLPDLRGRFMRGVDGTAGNDPDKAFRAASNAGGNTGNTVGSLQADDFKSHTHSITTYDNSGSVPNVVGSGGNPYTTSTTNASGGNETRPKNVNVNFIIKY